MHVEQWPIYRPIPYANNPRQISEEAIDKVAGSLKRFGWRQPIVVDADGVIIVGHTRLLAAKRLGLDHVPVHVAADMSEAEARSYRIADNRSGEESKWDYDLLKVEFAALDHDYNADLLDTGFDPSQIATLQDGPTDLSDVTDSSDCDLTEMESMSFSLHESQLGVIRDALATIPDREYEGNSNKHGNALYFLCCGVLGLDE